MKYINQLKYPHLLYVTKTSLEGRARERGKTSTIATSGCGMCSAVMVADRLLPNCEFDLSDAISLSYSVNANHKRGTDYERFAPAFAEKLGLRWEATKSIEDLRHCLRTGGAAVVWVGGECEGHIGLFTHGGHYMAVISEEADGRFAILDPSFRPDKFEEEGRQGKVEIKNDVIVLCDGKTLDEETETKPTPYHLFWRK